MHVFCVLYRIWLFEYRRTAHNAIELKFIGLFEFLWLLNVRPNVNVDYPHKMRKNIALFLLE